MSKRPYSTRTMRPEDWAEMLPYFKPSEFKYPYLMGYEYMRWLRHLRHVAGVPMRPTSDHRPDGYNETVPGAAANSVHELVPCNCGDYYVGDSSHAAFRVVYAAISAGCKRIGLYDTNNDGKFNVVHLDRAEDTHPVEVLWTRRKV